MAADDQIPLLPSLFQPAQEQVFALPGVDLAKDRFHDRFAPGVIEVWATSTV